MTNEEKLLIGTLAQSVAGKPLQMPEPVDWDVFMIHCLQQAVAPLTYDGLQRADLLSALPERYQTVLAQQYYSAVYKEAQLEYTKNLLSEKMTAANIKIAKYLIFFILPPVA